MTEQSATPKQPGATDAERNSAIVMKLSGAIIGAVDGLRQVGASNEQIAHATLWAGLVIAQRDIGGPGVCEWLRDNADQLERGIMDRMDPAPFN